MTDARITWDQDANAIYVRFSDADVAATLALSDTVYIDVDANGNPIGMEVLRVDFDIFATLKNLSGNPSLKDLIANAA